MPRDVLRAQLRSAALALLADGERVTVQRLREHGVRGGTATLIQLREELVAAGELPPEAAARVYAPSKHPPGRRSVERVGIVEREAWCVERNESDCTPHAARPTSERSERPHDSRAQRRSKRVVQEYNSAARRIFGRARARQIGAAP